jgi:hypothetical protein
LSTKTLKRYNLSIPEELFDEVEVIAKSHDTTVVDILRRFIKLGLLATKIQDDENSALLIREGDNERQIILL